MLCFGGLLRLALQASGADGHGQQWLQNTNAGAGSHEAPLLKNALDIPCPCTMLSNRRAEKPCSGIFFFLNAEQEADRNDGSLLHIFVPRLLSELQSFICININSVTCCRL